MRQYPIHSIDFAMNHPLCCPERYKVSMNAHENAKCEKEHSNLNYYLPTYRYQHV